MEAARTAVVDAYRGLLFAPPRVSAEVGDQRLVSTGGRIPWRFGRLPCLWSLAGIIGSGGACVGSGRVASGVRFRRGTGRSPYRSDGRRRGRCSGARRRCGRGHHRQRPAGVDAVVGDCSGSFAGRGTRFQPDSAARGGVRASPPDGNSAINVTVDGRSGSRCCWCRDRRPCDPLRPPGDFVRLDLTQHTSDNRRPEDALCARNSSGACGASGDRGQRDSPAQAASYDEPFFTTRDLTHLGAVALGDEAGRSSAGDLHAILLDRSRQLRRRQPSALRAITAPTSFSHRPLILWRVGGFVWLPGPVFRNVPEQWLHELTGGDVKGGMEFVARVAPQRRVAAAGRSPR